jgi:TadE-like protein
MTARPIFQGLRASKERVRAFGRHTEAVAAIELALVLPFLLLMFLGAIELSRFFMISKRVSNAAANMAQLLATSKGERTEGELSFIIQARLLVPTLAEDTQYGISYEDQHPTSLASIEFRPTVAGCTDNCTYEAFVTDSFAHQWWIGRPCGKQEKISDEAEPNYNGVPASLYGPGSVVVADFRYNYAPLFGGRFINKIGIQRAAFMAPRYLDTVKFQRAPDRQNPVRWC